MSFRQSAMRFDGRLAVILGVAVVLSGVVSPSAQDADPPMRTEEVVRMLVSGSSVREVLDEIAARPVEFDLSDEMLEELSIAGVPAEVIEAMKARQAELAPPPEPEEEEVEPPPEGSLTVVLWTAETLEPGSETEPAPPPALVFPGSLNPAAAASLQLRAEDEPPPVDELAVYLVCRTAYHVPDHWRSKSPLGRDFVSMPRHRILAFARSDERVERSKLTGKVLSWLTQSAPQGPNELVRLELPMTLEAEVDPHETHDLSLGVAIRTQGRFFRIVSDERDDVAFDGPTLTLRGRVGLTKEGLGIEAVFEDDAPES